MLQEVVIVEAVRTPVGRFRGKFAGVRADHLGAVALNAVVQRAGVAPEQVQDVVFGCVTQVGEQSANIARTSLLSAGWPDHVPGVTIDRKCGSAEAAVHLGAAMIASGQADLLCVGGAENMSRVPMGSNRSIHGDAFGPVLRDRHEMIPQGEAAERIAGRWGFSREAVDDFAMQSHTRAIAAQSASVFEREICPVPLADWAEPAEGGAAEPVTLDETVRHGTARDKLASLKPSFCEDGVCTAGNSSQIADGASALLLASAERAARDGLRARARVVAGLTVGSDPTLMLTGPVAATKAVLDRAGLQLDDIDLFEVNEAFGPIPLMWLRETGADPERLNVNGGAIALGHPLGCSGTRLMTTLLHEMERRNVRYGLQTMCCAGGLATATIIERL
ncbi:MAG: thiolase family protein [Rhizobiales bacterium]|nr:thiolase family protein [Hyphomicrobiales bacterium]OJU35745.1 MAG: acetyl-CoA acetyltransferase [Rhizobiales bacterium 68-8]